MERLTIPDEKIDGGWKRAFIDTEEVRKCAMSIYWALKKYEDTGLTPQEIMELKERDTAKKIVNYGVDVPECPHCGSLNIYYCEENMKYEYCPECGQRLKWED